MIDEYVGARVLGYLVKQSGDMGSSLIVTLRPDGKTETLEKELELWMRDENVEKPLEIMVTGAEYTHTVDHLDPLSTKQLDREGNVVYFVERVTFQNEVYLLEASEAEQKLRIGPKKS